MAAAQDASPSNYRRALTQQRRAQILVDDKLVEPQVSCAELEEQIQLLQQFYGRHDPSKVGRVPQILAWFYGREKHLFSAISHKYGEEVRPLVVHEVPLDERSRRIRDIDVAGDTSSSASSPGTGRTNTPTLVATSSTATLGSSPRTGHARRFFDGGAPGSPARSANKPKRNQSGGRGWFRGLAWQGAAQQPDRRRGSPRMPPPPPAYPPHYTHFQRSMSPGTVPGPYAGDPMRYPQMDPRLQQMQYPPGDPHAYAYPMPQGQARFDAYPAPVGHPGPRGAHGYAGGLSAEAQSFHMSPHAYYADRQRSGLRRTASDPQGCYISQMRDPLAPGLEQRRSSASRTRWDTRVFMAEQIESPVVSPRPDQGPVLTSRRSSRSLDGTQSARHEADLALSLPYPSDVPNPRRTASLSQITTRAQSEGYPGGKEGAEVMGAGFWTLATGSSPSGPEHDRGVLSSLAEEGPSSRLRLGPDFGRELRAGFECSPAESSSISSPLDSSGSSYFPEGSSQGGAPAPARAWNVRGSRTGSDPPPMLATFEETTELQTIETERDLELLDVIPPVEGRFYRERRTYSDPPRLMTVLEGAQRGRDRSALEIPDASVFSTDVKPGEFEEEPDLTLITSDEKLREIFAPPTAADMQAPSLYASTSGSRTRTHSAATERLHGERLSDAALEEALGEKGRESSDGELTQADIDAIFQQCRERTASTSSVATLNVAFDPRPRGTSSLSCASTVATGQDESTDVPPAPDGSPTGPRQSAAGKQK